MVFFGVKVFICGFWQRLHTFYRPIFGGCYVVVMTFMDFRVKGCNRCLLVGVVSFIGLMVSGVSGQEREKTGAEVRVQAFESEMMKQLIAGEGIDDKVRDSKVFQDKVRAFFTGLDTSELRLEAIGLLDGRYVYIVSPDFADELLGSFIRDEDVDVRVRAADAIAYHGCGVLYAKELVGLLDGEPSEKALINVARAMGFSGKGGKELFVPHLKKMLMSEYAEARAAASEALTELDPMTAYEFNVELLGDEDAVVRKAAIRNLSSPRANVVVISLMGMLEDKDADVRREAVLALGKMKAEWAADALKERLSDEDRGVRSHAALALGKMGKHAWDVLQMTVDDDVVVRRHATIAMGLMGDARYVENLKSLLKDEDEQVREYAGEAIRLLGGEVGDVGKGSE